MRFNAIAIIMLAAAAAVSCGEKQLTPDPGSTGPLPGKLVLSTKVTDYNFSRTGKGEDGKEQEYSVSFTSNRAWKAKSSAAWLTVTPASGSKGTENIISFKASANPNYQDQKAVLSLTCGDLVKDLNIVQAGYGIRPAKPKLVLAGDSICTEYNESAYPQTGWGQCIGAAIGEGVTVVNCAVGGESTKSFIDEGKWDELLAQVDSGDVVFINFGHNDEKTDAAHATSTTVYKNNLIKFVNDVRTKGGSPVLVTPMTRRQFNEDGLLKRSHGEYPSNMIAAASSTRTPLIDLENKSYDWLAALGLEASDPYYVTDKRDGDDNTHLTDVGAQLVAGWIAEDFKKTGLWIW